MRSLLSKQVAVDEQGKIFAAVGFLEGICDLSASTVFNNLYPATLSFYPGFSYLLMSVVIVVPLGIMFYLSRNQIDLENAKNPTSTSSDEEEEENGIFEAAIVSGIDEDEGNLSVRF